MPAIVFETIEFLNCSWILHTFREFIFSNSGAFYQHVPVITLHHLASSLNAFIIFQSFGLSVWTDNQWRRIRYFTFGAFCATRYSIYTRENLSIFRVPYIFVQLNLIESHFQITIFYESGHWRNNIKEKGNGTGRNNIENE